MMGSSWSSSWPAMGKYGYANYANLILHKCTYNTALERHKLALHLGQSQVVLTVGAIVKKQGNKL